MQWDAVSAIATSGAAVTALVIWRCDIRRARRARAGRLTLRLEYREQVPSLVVRNGADAPAYEINIRSSRIVAQPRLVHLLPPGQEYCEPVSEDFIDYTAVDGADLDTCFTMDERRWQIGPTGRLSGGGRDHPGKQDPEVSVHEER